MLILVGAVVMSTLEGVCVLVAVFFSFFYSSGMWLPVPLVRRFPSVVELIAISHCAALCHYSDISSTCSNRAS